MADPDFDIYDVRHGLAAAFNVIGIVLDPEALRRLPAGETMQSLREVLHDVLRDAIAMLKARPLEGEATRTDTLIDVLGAVDAALERWTDEAAPPSGVIAQVRNHRNRLEECRPAGGWNRVEFSQARARAGSRRVDG